MSTDEYIDELLQLSEGYGALDDKIAALRREAHAYFGRAMYLCQAIERGLINLLMVSGTLAKLNGWKDFPHVDRDFDDMEAIYSKQTLGRLLRALRIQKRVSIDSRLLDNLEEFLKSRNFFTHSFFYERDAKFHSEKGLIEIIKECDEFYTNHEPLEEACDLTERILLEFAGVERPTIEKISRDLLQKHRRYGESEPIPEP